MSILNKYRVVAEELNAKRSHYNQQVQDERKALNAAKETLVCVAEAQNVLQRVALAVQQEAHDRIATVVTKCLRAVFDQPYEFRIKFERKRGRTEAALEFIRGDIVADPLTASGGGVVNVAAFALRLACLVLSQPQHRLLLLLDEPFVHVSEEYRPRVCEMLKMLADDLGVQFVIVTHSPDFVTGEVVQL